MPYSEGKIYIPSVTGNIVINVSASQLVQDYTNLADPSSEDWKTGYRLSTNSVSSAGQSSIITNLIPCSENDIIRVKGLDIRYYEGSSQARFHLLAENRLIIHDANYFKMLLDNGVATFQNDTFTFKAGHYWSTRDECVEGLSYERFNGVLMTGYTANDVVITVNEPIG